ncbi:MAG: sugar phosphate isomerase/epimerase family protein [Stackebrandtia sp.]
MTPTIRYAGIGDEAGDDLGTQLAALAELGWNAIELRSVDSTMIADLDDAAFERVAEAIAARGMDVCGVASSIGNWSRPISTDFAVDVAELGRLAPRCRALGTNYLRVMSYPNAGLDQPRWRHLVLRRFRELADRAQDAGLVLLHENCAGWAGSHAKRALELVSVVDSPALRLLFDTGNGLAYEYDAYQMLTEVVEHVAHVHVKDANPGPVYTVPGTGIVRVADCLRLLLANGFAGTWSIEPHVAFRPHEAESGGDRYAGFVACGRALEQLVRDRVLPEAGWRAVPAGISSRETG